MNIKHESECAFKDECQNCKSKCSACNKFFIRSEFTDHEEKCKKEKEEREKKIREDRERLLGSAISGDGLEFSMMAQGGRQPLFD